MQERATVFKEHADLFKPNATELLNLKKTEPHVIFKEIPITAFVSEGRQSRVSVLEYGEGDKLNRIIWKRMGVDKSLTQKEAVLLHERLQPYKKSLIDYGWVVPAIYHTEVIEIDGEYQIFSYEQFISGGDGEKMVMNPSEPNFRKWFLLRKVIESLANYPIGSTKRSEIKGVELSLLPHGLDLKLANVVLDKSGTLFFVDIFGPKELTTDGAWVTYSKKLDSLPENSLIAVCATREGSLLRLYRLLEKKWADTGGMDTDYLRQAFGEILKHLGFPNHESDFIQKEIASGYPWLDSIYNEKAV